MILENINSPEDVKKMSREELNLLKYAKHCCTG